MYYIIHNKPSQMMNAPGIKDYQDKTPSLLYADHIVPRSRLSDQQNSRYYDEYKKLLFTSYCIDKQLLEFFHLKANLQAQVAACEKNFVGNASIEVPVESQVSSEGAKPKRYRRTNQMIQRNFSCQFQKCDKSYASEGSLQQHIKLKHEKKAKEAGSSVGKDGAK